jgi:hypothetical protein
MPASETPVDPLAELPDLISQAHSILAASTGEDDPEVEALLADLESCVIAAHRLMLRRRMAAARRG